MHPNLPTMLYGAAICSAMQWSCVVGEDWGIQSRIPNALQHFLSGPCHFMSKNSNKDIFFIHFLLASIPYIWVHFWCYCQCSVHMFVTWFKMFVKSATNQHYPLPIPEIIMIKQKELHSFVQTSILKYTRASSEDSFVATRARSLVKLLTFAFPVICLTNY